MANTQAVCSSFKRDLLNGLHAFGTTVARGGTTKDDFKAALYLASATINGSTTTYTATGEISSGGYTAGGLAVTNATAPTLDSTTAHWTPSAALAWTGLTVTAMDCMMLYNDTSASDLSCAVFTFGSTTLTAGDFQLNMPTNDGTTGLIRLA